MSQGCIVIHYNFSTSQGGIHITAHNLCGDTINKCSTYNATFHNTQYIGFREGMGSVSVLEIELCIKEPNIVASTSSGNWDVRTNHFVVILPTPRKRTRRKKNVRQRR